MRTGDVKVRLALPIHLLCQHHHMSHGTERNEGLTANSRRRWSPGTDLVNFSLSGFCDTWTGPGIRTNLYRFTSDRIEIHLLFLLSNRLGLTAGYIDSGSFF